MEHALLIYESVTSMAMYNHELNWTGGLTLKFASMFFDKIHSPVELCRNPAAFSLYALVLVQITNYSML